MGTWPPLYLHVITHLLHKKHRITSVCYHYNLALSFKDIGNWRILEFISVEMTEAGILSYKISK